MILEHEGRVGDQEQAQQGKMPSCPADTEPPGQQAAHRHAAEGQQGCDVAAHEGRPVEFVEDGHEQCCGPEDGQRKAATLPGVSDQAGHQEGTVDQKGGEFQPGRHLALLGVS